MRESCPFFAVDGSTMIDRPPLEYIAPIMKVICPPMPEYICGPMDSAAACPVKSIASVLFTATCEFCAAMVNSEFVWSTLYNSKAGLLLTNSRSAAPTTIAATALPLCIGFILAGRHATLDQLHMARRHNFAVNAQVVTVHKKQTHGFGNRADAHLHGITVADQVEANSPITSKVPCSSSGGGLVPTGYGLGFFHQIVDL